MIRSSYMSFMKKMEKDSLSCRDFYKKERASCVEAIYILCDTLTYLRGTCLDNFSNCCK